MKVNIKLLLIFFVFLSNMGFIYGSEDEPYLRCYNQIITSFVKEVQKNYGLTCIGNGGSMHDEIEHVSVFLCSSREANVDEARDIIIITTEKLVSLFQNNKEIESFLRKDFFNSQSFSVSISFSRKNLPSSIDQVLNTNNKISYLKDEGQFGKRIKISEEPYEEALKIVQNRSSLGF